VLAYHRSVQFIPECFVEGLQVRPQVCHGITGDDEERRAIPMVFHEFTGLAKMESRSM
jgi:hypothetical protein